MTAPDDGLTALLAEHWSASTHTDRKPYVDKCDGCGAVILEWGQPVPSDARLWLAAHQAAVVRAAGWAKGREEWAYGDDPVCPVEMWSEDDARKAAERHETSVFRRTVTAWEESE